MKRAYLVLSLLVSAAAHAAAGDAWDYAKGVLPADANFVVGADFDALRKTSVFTALYPTFLARSGAKPYLEEVKTACGLDLKDEIQGVVVAWSDKLEDGAVFLAGPRLEAKEVVDCREKLTALRSADKKKKKVTASAPGAQGLIEVTVEGEKDKLYFAFPRKGLMVIGFNPTEKPTLARWIGGKGLPADGEVSRSLAKISTAAPVWGAMGAFQKPLGDPDSRVKAGAGQAIRQGEGVKVDLKITMATPKEAQTALDKAKKELADAKKQGPPPEVVRAMDSAKLTVTGSDLQATFSISDADLISLVKQM